MKTYKNINPITCNTMNFFQYYGDAKKVENKHVEYDTCWYYDKNCYSYSQAVQILKGMKTSHSRTSNKLNLRIYKCEHCGSWHLTSVVKTKKGHKKLQYAA